MYGSETRDHNQTKHDKGKVTYSASCPMNVAICTFLEALCQLLSLFSVCSITSLFLPLCNNLNLSLNKLALLYAPINAAICTLLKKPFLDCFLGLRSQHHAASPPANDPPQGQQSTDSNPLTIGGTGGKKGLQ